MIDKLAACNQYRMGDDSVFETENCLIHSLIVVRTAQQLTAKLTNKFDVEIALYDQHFARGLLAYRRLEALEARSPLPSAQTDAIDSNSELSTVSESRFAGLDEDWWKDKKVGGTEVTIVTTTAKPKKQVHWE
jgi:hypothetical protein